MTDENEGTPAEETTQPGTPAAQPTDVVQPGCNEPNTVPPSVVGTSQDPNRKE